MTTNQSDSSQARWLGVMCVLAALVGWSSIPLFLKHFSHSIDPWTSNGWRYGFSALFWSPVVVIGLARQSLPAGIWRAAFWPSAINCGAQVVFCWAHYKIEPGLLAFGLRSNIVFAVVGAALMFALLPANAARIENPVAVFSGIDKITGRITTFDVYVGETVQFGALQVTPRVCYSRDQTEPPKTTTFVEVDEITLDRKIRRLFTGWMFADSPGLNAVDHAVYDVWLKECKQQSDVPAPSDETPVN